MFSKLQHNNYIFLQDEIIKYLTVLDKLWVNKEKLTRAGFELATSGLTCRRSTNWANIQNLFDKMIDNDMHTNVYTNC